MRRSGRTIVVLGLLSLSPTVRLTAQCPDGSPPPCRSVRVAVTAPAPNSVAVLYFDNLSPDSGDAYLADGLTEELITRLGQSRLVVKPRNSVRRYRGASASDPVAMGQVLGVAYLLSGSVRRGANRVRVTVELTRARTGVRIWGDSYDITNTDPLEVQQQVAAAVTVRIVGQLSPSERASLVAFPTKSREAYDHFLRGLHYMGPRDQRGLFRALEQFEAAVRLDPSFARAYARIGVVCVLIILRSDSVATAHFLAQGTAAIDRALQLDSTISDAWVGRGRLLAIERGPFDEGVQTSYERAISLDSTNAEARHFYAVNLLHYWGDWNRALQQLRQAIALEPDRLNTLNMLGFAESVARRAPEAVRWWDSIIALQPTGVAPALIGAHVNRASERLIVLRDTVGARNDVDEISRLGNPGASHAIMALLEVRRGDTAAARIHFSQAWAMAGWSDTHCGPLEGAVLVELGEHDRALDCVEHIDREEFPFLFPYLHLAFFDPIRSEARFQKVVDRLRPPQRPQPTRAP